MQIKGKIGVTRTWKDQKEKSGERVCNIANNGKKNPKMNSESNTHIWIQRKACRIVLGH